MLLLTDEQVAEGLAIAGAALNGKPLPLAAMNTLRPTLQLARLAMALQERLQAAEQRAEQFEEERYDCPACGGSASKVYQESGCTDCYSTGTVTGALSFVSEQLQAAEKDRDTLEDANDSLRQRLQTAEAELVVLRAGSQK